MFADAGSNSIVGAFNVGCQTGGGYKCGPYSASAPAGGCAGLLACCGDDLGCKSFYDASMPDGEVACGRVFSVDKGVYCP